MIVVFVERKHILPKDMTYTINKYSFTCLPMARKRKMQWKKLFQPYIRITYRLKKKEIFLLFTKSFRYCYDFSTQLATAHAWFLLTLRMILLMELRYLVYLVGITIIIVHTSRVSIREKIPICSIGSYIIL